MLSEEQFFFGFSDCQLMADLEKTTGKLHFLHIQIIQKNSFRLPKYFVDQKELYNFLNRI